MLEILGAFVVKGLNKITDTAIDLKKESISEQRKFVYKLLGLYNSLVDLEQESRKVLTEFLGYANGTETLTRTIPSSRLSQLEQSLETFQSHLTPISNILEIYDGELHVALFDTYGRKGGNIEEYDSFLLPEIVEIGYLMTVPTKRPTGKALKRLLALKETSSSEKEFLDHPMVKEAHGIEVIDLRDRERLKKLLKNCELAMGDIAKSKTQLAKLIRTNFSIDKIVV